MTILGGHGHHGGGGGMAGPMIGHLFATFVPYVANGTPRFLGARMTAVLPFFVTFASGMPTLGVFMLVLQEFMSWVVHVLLDAIICTGAEDTTSCVVFYPLAYPHSSAGSSDDPHSAPATLGAVEVGRWLLARMLVGFLSIFVAHWCNIWATRMRHGQRVLAFSLPLGTKVYPIADNATAPMEARTLLDTIGATSGVAITDEERKAFEDTDVAPWIDMAHGVRGGWCLRWMSCRCLPYACGGSDRSIQPEPYGLGVSTDIADRVTWVWMFAWVNFLAALCLLSDLAPAFGWIYVGDDPLWIVRAGGVPCLFALCVVCMHLVMYLWIYPSHADREKREKNITAYAWRVTTLAREYITLYFLGPGAISLYIGITGIVLTPWMFSTSVLGSINYATGMPEWRDAHIYAEFLELFVSLTALILVFFYAYVVYWIKTSRYDREQLAIMQSIADNKSILRMD